MVDQFEETFTLCTDEAKRAVFVANLLGLVAEPTTAHRVILTMRNDYESWVSRIPDLQDAFVQGRVQATPLSAEELRRAILEPAEMVGLRFQDGIVEALELTEEEAVRAPFLLGVQFHPERLYEKHPEQLKIFKAFTRACRHDLYVETPVDVPL